MQNQNNETKYFDLHTTGIGYINRFRQVKPKQGNSFYSCTIGALRGNTDNSQYTYFDVKIVNEEALNVLLNYVDEDDKDTKVLAGFKLGDIYPETFVYSKGEKKGETGVMLKGRLIKLSWLKVNDEMVYQHDNANETASAQSADDQVNRHVVKLDRNDPDFETKKNELKERGYKFNSQDKTWVLAA